MSAIRNSGVSVFEGVVKCAINGIYCSDYALCPHYSVSPHFRGVRREGFHCINSAHVYNFMTQPPQRLIRYEIHVFHAVGVAQARTTSWKLQEGWVNHPALPKTLHCY